MIIQECTFQPILLDSRCLRKGILLQLTSKDGRQAWAEISPLPGHNKETLDDAYDQLQLMKRRLLTTWWSKQALHYLSNWKLYPSVHFGLESALRDLVDPLNPPHTAKSYALLLGTPEEILQRARDVSEEGFSEAKIKLGHFSVHMAKELLDSLDPSLRLRLDLNKKWTLEESLSLCSHYPRDHFTYIEEPCKNLDDLARFPYPFALDESLRDIPLSSPLLQNPHLKALILKPTLLYPLSPFLELGPEIVLTSCFEGRIGIGQIRKLIARLGLLDTLHGLDSLRYFETSEDPDEMPHRLLASQAP